MIAIIGANGRMGTQMQQYLTKINKSFVCIDIENKNDSFNDIDGIIDFSSPLALSDNLDMAKKRNVPIVIGTTNHDKVNLLKIKKYSKTIPIFIDSNFSLQFNVMLKMLSSLACLKNNEFLLQEIHHKNKKDSPSGSAKKMINKLNLIGVEPNVIAIRIADVVGEHSLKIYGQSEVLEIKHIAKSREIFCEGAVKALEFIKTKQKGLYNMEDLLNYNDSL